MLITVFNWFIHLNNPIVAVLLIASPFIIAGIRERMIDSRLKIGNLVYDTNSRRMGKIVGEIQLDSCFMMRDSQGGAWFASIYRIRRLTPKERFDYYVQSL